ncbi:A24 family peptidase [Methyloterricola oryzae]|uniref:A24 family peptidase n=1 Tax=Methyloterricola oryzae TaxID=1495050 RepID=UPI00069C67CD|nr:prepilin peptidase [Methyloterricola oryzae]
MTSVGDAPPAALTALLAILTEHLQTLLVCLLVIAATIVDFLTHRIPNALCVSGLAAGLLLLSFLHGWGGLLNSLAGFATGLCIFLPLYAIGWMGAGDVKLMAATGSLLGWPVSLLAVGLSSGVGSLIALCLIGLRGGLGAYLARYWLMFKCLLLTGLCSYTPPRPASAATLRFPYAIAIALGTLGALAWTGAFTPIFKCLWAG